MINLIREEIILTKEEPKEEQQQKSNITTTNNTQTTIKEPLLKESNEMKVKEKEKMLNETISTIDSLLNNNCYETTIDNFNNNFNNNNNNNRENNMENNNNTNSNNSSRENSICYSISSSSSSSNNTPNTNNSSLNTLNNNNNNNNNTLNTNNNASSLNNKLEKKRKSGIIIQSINDIHLLNDKEEQKLEENSTINNEEEEEEVDNTCCCCGISSCCSSKKFKTTNATTQTINNNLNGNNNLNNNNENNINENTNLIITTSCCNNNTTADNNDNINTTCPTINNNNLNNNNLNNNSTNNLNNNIITSTTTTTMKDKYDHLVENYSSVSHYSLNFFSFPHQLDKTTIPKKWHYLLKSQAYLILFFTYSGYLITTLYAYFKQDSLQIAFYSILLSLLMILVNSGKLIRMEQAVDTFETRCIILFNLINFSLRFFLIEDKAMLIMNLGIIAVMSKTTAHARGSPFWAMLPIIVMSGHYVVYAIYRIIVVLFFMENNTLQYGLQNGINNVNYTLQYGLQSDVLQNGVLQNCLQNCLQNNNLQKSDLILDIIFEYTPHVFCIVTFGLFIVFGQIQLSSECDTLQCTSVRLQNALEAKNHFVSHISHEFRCPILSSLGSIELIKETNLTKEQLEHVDTIESANSILLSLIEDILLFVKTEHESTKRNLLNSSLNGNNNYNVIGGIDGNERTSENGGNKISGPGNFSGNVVEDNLDKHTFNLFKCLNTIYGIIKSYATKFKVTIELKLDKDINENLFINTNQARLQQAIVNLMTNAVKASKPNGIVELHCKPINNPHYTLNNNTNNTTLNNNLNNNHSVNGNVNWFEFCIIDYGVGIPKSKQEAIFQPFTQLHNLNESIFPGSGLGLCTVLHIVKSMNGSIELDSEEGKGSKFKIIVPIEVIIQNNNITTSTSPNTINGNAAITTTLNGNNDGVMNDDVSILIGNSIKRQIQIQGNYLDQFKKAQQEEKSLNNNLTNNNCNNCKNLTNNNLNNTTNNNLNDINNNCNCNNSINDNLIKIIIAEDNAINRKVLTKMLKSLGYEVDAVCDGKQLVEKFNPKIHKLIITDQHMPNMTGINAATEIRNLYNNKDIKIILLTADALTNAGKYLMVVDVIINKPCTRQDLKMNIERLLNSSNDGCCEEKENKTIVGEEVKVKQ